MNADTNGDSTVDAHHALRVDLSATGADVTVGVSGFGVEVTGTVALELLIATESGDSRVWIAASGSSLGTTVALGPVSATLSNVSLLVNSASGADAAHNAATAIQDWTTATVGGTLTFASPGAFTHVSGHVDTLDVAGVAEGAATSFDITQSTVSNSGLSLTDAKLVHFAVTGLTGAIGGSGYGVTVSGDLTVDALSDTLSSKRWLAAYGHNLSLDVELAPLQISATAATLKLNRATNATVISDWSPFDASLPTFPSSGDYLDVSGSVTTITIGGFASVSVPTVSLTRAYGCLDPGRSGDPLHADAQRHPAERGPDGDGAHDQRRQPRRLRPDRRDAQLVRSRRLGLRCPCCARAADPRCVKRCRVPVEHAQCRCSCTR